MIEKFSKQYLAGFIDGEGCIAIYGKLSKIYRTHTTAVRIANIDKRALEFLYKKYGGWLGIQKGRGNRRDSWAYYVTGERAYKLIIDISPYIIIKKPQIKLILDNWKWLKPRRGGRHWLPEDVKKMRHKIYLKMRKLNRRGKN